MFPFLLCQKKDICSFSYPDSYYFSVQFSVFVLSFAIFPVILLKKDDCVLCAELRNRRRSRSFQVMPDQAVLYSSLCDDFKNYFYYWLLWNKIKQPRWSIAGFRGCKVGEIQFFETQRDCVLKIRKRMGLGTEMISAEWKQAFIN